VEDALAEALAIVPGYPIVAAIRSPNSSGRAPVVAATDQVWAATVHPYLFLIR